VHIASGQLLRQVQYCVLEVAGLFTVLMLVGQGMSLSDTTFSAPQTQSLTPGAASLIRNFPRTAAAMLRKIIGARRRFWKLLGGNQRACIRASRCR